MKNEPSHAPSSVKPLPSKHQFDHEVHTAIHDPEEDMMVLARWTHRALQNPTRFWGTLIGIVAAILLIVLLANSAMTNGTRGGDVWSKLEAAKSPGDRLEVAESYPGSPAAVWARLQAATEYYNQGFADLPNNRDTALPVLKKALDQFDQVVKESPKDSPQARAAALGKARTLEARNELPKAIDEYKNIQKTWPGSAEADQAKELAAALENPEAASFYKDLYAYSPTKVTLPPLGTENLNLPILPAPPGGGLSAESPLGGIAPSIPLLPPPPPRAVGNTETPAATDKGKAATSPEPAAKPASGSPAPAPASPPATTSPTPKSADTPAPAPKPADTPTPAPKPAEPPTPKPADTPSAPKGEVPKTKS